ncbi:MAG: metalloregulator ArsR/SmtB family transcription factor [Vicingaceae bacterium]
MSKKRDQIFKAIADPTRREIFHLLIMGSALSITQLSSHFDISRQGITKHVKLLEEAKMVNLEKEGRERICYAQAKALKEVKEWLSFYDVFWDDKLSALEDHLNKQA